MKTSWLLPSLLTLVACGAEPPEPASDFAVLASAAEGYEQAEPGRPLQFPQDHGAHPGFRIEWWYLTANLQDAKGGHYGAQWTLFRVATKSPQDSLSLPSASASPWHDPQVFMAHFALSWPEGHRAWQRYARGGEHDGQARAGVQASPFAAWMDDWRLASTGQDWLPMTVSASAASHGMQLSLSSDRNLVPQGEGGFSQKHPGGGGSYYYSQPFLNAEGTLELDGEVIPVQGQAWLDREWSSQFLQADQAGWDWFSLHLDSGEKLMLFRLRELAGEGDANYVHGTLIQPNGSKQLLDPRQITFNTIERFPVAGRNLPLRWRIELPQIGRTLDLRPLHPDQWMTVDFPYWEGVILATGEGPANSGHGFMELTGYPVLTRQ